MVLIHSKLLKEDINTMDIQIEFGGTIRYIDGPFKIKASLGDLASLLYAVQQAMMNATVDNGDWIEVEDLNPVNPINPINPVSQPTSNYWTALPHFLVP